MAPTVATRVAFTNILLATDFSDVSHQALLHALAMAKRYDAKLTVAHVAPPETQTPIPMEPVPLELDWQKKHAAASLARLEDFEPLHMYPHDTVLKQGDPWGQLSEIVDSKGIDLIVLGTRGRGLLGTLFLGSVAEQVLRHATCPVLTIGPDVSTGFVDHERCTHILFPTDFSEDSPRSLSYALSLAEEDNADLTLMHVMRNVHPLPVAYSTELLAERRQHLWQMVPEEARIWCKPHVTVEIGDAGKAIVRKACDKHVDLIVMSVHPGGTVANHLPWTVVHSVVRHAPCPVLTTRTETRQIETP